MSDLAQPGESEDVTASGLMGISVLELSVREVLCAADGFVNLDTIVLAVIDDAEMVTYEMLEGLRLRGVVSCDADDRWRIRKPPTTTLSLNGDPNFRRGDR